MTSPQVFISKFENIQHGQGGQHFGHMATLSISYFQMALPFCMFILENDF